MTDTKKRFTKIFLILLSYLFILLRFFCIYFFNSGFEIFTLLKMLASSCPVLLAFLLLRESFSLEGKFLFAGLCFCYVADLILEFSFIPGGCVFAAAHFIFLFGFIKTGKNHKKQIIVLTILEILAIPLYIIFADKFTGILPLVIIYFSLLFCIISFSIGHKKILVFATVAFFISDISLVINNFISSSMPASIFCLAAYYTSLSLFALSCEKK